MTKEQFLTEMQDVLQTDEALSSETVLSDLVEWDSLAKMATMAFVEKKLGVKLTLGEINAFVTVGDIAKKGAL